MINFVSMKVDLWLASRLKLRSGGSRSSATTGAVIAVAGVALALVVMELTLAVVCGFKHDITAKLRGFEADISVLPAYDYDTATSAPYITASPQLRSLIGAKAALAMRLPGMLKTDSDFAVVEYRAWDSNHDFSFEQANVISGRWPQYADSPGAADSLIVVSALTASRLALAPGSKVHSCYFVDGSIKTRRHTVAAIYESHFGDYDKSVAYASLPALQRIAGIAPDGGSRLEIRGLALDSIAPAADRLQQRLIDAYQAGAIAELHPTDNLTREGAIYLNWLALLDTNVLVIFVLMICVAAFTLVSSLFILVLERVSTIGLLRALGASRRVVRNIFIYMALRLAGLGIIIGNIVGIGLALLQLHTHALPLDPEMYYLSHVPILIEPYMFIVLNVGVALVCWAVLVLPASFAARRSPAATLRFE